MREVDALIVGGGPAGVSAAIVLAEHGLRTLLCEQRGFPVDKACGEGVMPTGLAQLERLGVRRHLPADGVRPFRGIRYHSPRGRVAAAEFAEGPGWGIRRTALSAALRRRAGELATLEVREGQVAEPLGCEGDRLVVRVGDERARTRLLVGADGLGSRIRRWARLDARSLRRPRFGARRHFRIRPWSDYVEVHWKDGIEAYVTPCGEEEVGIAFLWDARRHEAVPGGSRLFPALLREFPALAARLGAAVACDRLRASGPFHRAVRSPVGDGVLLIGDAAGYLDAITGEGISLATAEALSLGTTVVPLLARPDGGLLRAHALGAYARAQSAIVAPYYRVTRLVLLLSRHPRLAERVIAALASETEVFRHMLSANMGLRSPWALGPRALGRLVGALVCAAPPLARPEVGS